MASYREAKSQTVESAAAYAKIVWEPCEIGYWFLAEIAAVCPRTKTSWNDLTSTVSGIRLPSLEEYAIVYWTHLDFTGERIDDGTWCWLRTRLRFGTGALNAGVNAGELHILESAYSNLAVPFDVGGGRRVVNVVRAQAA